MDIGDPSEIPATRRRLPSMQELGAFDFGAPGEAGATADSRPTPLPERQPDTVRPAVAGEARTGPAGTEAVPATAGLTADVRGPAAAVTAARAAPPAPAAPPVAGPRPALTAEQLRQALAKADPGTRQKLMRLIAGGRTVQQLAGGAPAEGVKRRSLVMQLDTPSPTSAPAPAPVSAPASARPPAPMPRPEAGGASSDFAAFDAGRGGARGAAAGSPGFTSARAPGQQFTGRASRPGERPLMQIDAHTELLDAAPPPVSPAARKAELQAQLDQVPRQATVAESARSEPLAHKVLFPAYDPQRHGEDVHGRARRRHEGPIEGHFPAPRQPFKPQYQHPDGRPMTAEESQVEEVLQTQRCEETLGVLAREGVNGLLLSPRDLDAAVANGVISAEAAATLWKTWAALRPVIHVIEDDPPAPAATEATDAAHDTDTGPDAQAALSETAETADDKPASAVEVPGPGAAPGPAAPAVPTPMPQRSEPVASSAEQTPSAVPIAAAAPVAPRPAQAQSVEAITLPLPGRQRPAEPQGAAPATAAEAPNPAPALSRWTRLKARLKTLAWWFVAYCVLVTSSRLAMDAWLRWGHWVSGWPGP